MAGESKIKLSYFTLVGLAEPIRFMLSYLGKDFEDYRFGGKEWLTIKPNTPWGKCPVLELNGQKLTQNVAICRYLGKEAGLGGKDNWEDLKIDEIIDVLTDLRIGYLYCRCHERVSLAAINRMDKSARRCHTTRDVMDKNPSMTLKLEINNGLNVTSKPPPMARQAGCLQGQGRSAVTHPSDCHAYSHDFCCFAHN
ncbi:hypothetical protein J6590_003662 [Homalodisca vitripennis]|nr:hypothetical protein J6590_003662 [Homalodisca vitripennis]